MGFLPIIGILLSLLAIVLASKATLNMSGKTSESANSLSAKFKTYNSESSS